MAHGSRFADRGLRPAVRGSKPVAWGWRLCAEPVTRFGRARGGGVQGLRFADRGPQIEARRSRPAASGLRFAAGCCRQRSAAWRRAGHTLRAARGSRLAAQGPYGQRSAASLRAGSRSGRLATCDLRLAARSLRPGAGGFASSRPHVPRGSRPGWCSWGSGCCGSGGGSGPCRRPWCRGCSPGSGSFWSPGRCTRSVMRPRRRTGSGSSRPAARGLRPAACGLRPAASLPGRSRPPPPVAQGPPPRRPCPAPRPTEPRSLPAPTSPPLLSPPHLSSLTKIHLHPAPTPVTMAV